MSYLSIMRALGGQPVSELLNRVKASIRKNPGDADLRAQLFQLLVITGDWDKACDQLTLSAEMNAQAQPLAVAYGGAIRAEQEREAVFRGETIPAVLARPPAWMAMLIEALKTPDEEQAAGLRAVAMETAPGSIGQLDIDGQDNTLSFEWICDGDGRIGPVCELIVNGRYGWVPFESIASIRFIAPQGLTDLVWAQVEVDMQDKRQYTGLMPVRYPAPAGSSYARLDDAANLSHRTEWQYCSEQVYFGIGQKMWMTANSEQAILDVRRVVFNHEAKNG
ncbi:type VI secretion system accessory protein TagJ [Advenella sp. EE-W14]|uniref:type VI secretion system accessory protein TagJ n=1 Tax=Advenella sp. EE-W14 TaxID=2722705 RepID=UPI00145FC85E|nr:type VI secretion system accessory protein TagJ [Advenella sp. EE-W14]